MELRIVHPDETGEIDQKDISTNEPEIGLIGRIGNELGLKPFVDGKRDRRDVRRKPGLIVVESSSPSEFERRVNSLIAEEYKVVSVYCGPGKSGISEAEPPIGKNETVSALFASTTPSIIYIATMLMHDDHILSM